MSSIKFALQRTKKQYLCQRNDYDKGGRINNYIMLSFHESAMW